ncbi:hypothetical protein B0H16DRAFT_1688497 [Mycena metata]|uniref:Uncharacterized protein n=1 Tax=Mycena metata TaxID=1033252 RepID=A0AAD7NGK9_9AGAR|nr:hypothetical protein B0H16DRAFT_1688497 [Mycena metata]
MPFLDALKNSASDKRGRGRFAGGCRVEGMDLGMKRWRRDKGTMLVLLVLEQRERRAPWQRAAHTRPARGTRPTLASVKRSRVGCTHWLICYAEFCVIVVVADVDGVPLGSQRREAGGGGARKRLPFGKFQIGNVQFLYRPLWVLGGLQPRAFGDGINLESTMALRLRLKSSSIEHRFNFNLPRNGLGSITASAGILRRKSTVTQLNIELEPIPSEASLRFQSNVFNADLTHLALAFTGNPKKTALQAQFNSTAFSLPIYRVCTEARIEFASGFPALPWVLFEQHRKEGIGERGVHVGRYVRVDCAQRIDSPRACSRVCGHTAAASARAVGLSVRDSRAFGTLGLATGYPAHTVGSGKTQSAWARQHLTRLDGAQNENNRRRDGDAGGRVRDEGTREGGYETSGPREMATRETKEGEGGDDGCDAKKEAEVPTVPPLIILLIKQHRRSPQPRKKRTLCRDVGA